MNRFVPGFGCALSNICCLTTLSRAVHGRRQMLFLSICVASNGTHQLFYPFIFDTWTKQYGLNGTWLLTGALMLNVWALPLMLYMNRDTCFGRFNNKGTNINNKYSTTNATTLQSNTTKLVKNITITQTFLIKHGAKIALVVLILGSGITIGAGNAFTALMMDIFRWKGYSVDQTLKVFIPLSIFNILSRLVTGLIKQRRGINTFVFPMLAIIGGIAGQTLVLLFDNFIVLSVGATLTSITNGGVISTAVVLVVKLSKDGGPLETGILTTTCGILSAAASPLFGKTLYELPYNLLWLSLLLMSNFKTVSPLFGKTRPVIYFHYSIIHVYR